MVTSTGKLTEATGKKISNFLNKIGSQEFVDRMGQMSGDRLANDMDEQQNDCCWHIRDKVNAHWHSIEYVMGVVVVANLFVIIIEIDRTTEDLEVDAFHWTEVFGWIALLLFDLELLVRLVAFGRRFWRQYWNVFDFIVSITDTTFSLVGLFAHDLFPVSMLRVFRLAKLARISKVLRVFPELRLLLGALLGSLSAIFWGALLLMFWLLVWSMVAVLFIHPLNVNIEYGLECDRCHRAYSSVMQAALTFWTQMVTGDSGAETTIPLLEKHPITACFFIPMFMSVSMAVMNLILGVVVQVAQDAKEELEAEDSAQHALFKLEQQSHLFQICRAMDDDGDGCLSFDEIHRGFLDSIEFQAIMVSLDRSEEHLNVAWEMMDGNRTGVVSYKQFVANLCKMKASDSNFMLAYIKYHITRLSNVLLKEAQNQEVAQRGTEDIKKARDSRDSLCSTIDEDRHDSDTDVLDDALEVHETRAASSIVASANNSQPAPVPNAIFSQDQCCKGRNKDSNLDETSSLAPSKEVQPWVLTVCNEIDAMRVELSCKLVELDRKFEAQSISFLGTETDIVSSQRNFERPTVPGNSASAAPSSMQPLCLTYCVPSNQDNLRQSLPAQSTVHSQLAQSVVNALDEYGVATSKDIHSIFDIIGKFQNRVSELEERVCSMKKIQHEVNDEKAALLLLGTEAVPPPALVSPSQAPASSFDGSQTRSIDCSRFDQIDTDSCYEEDHDLQGLFSSDEDGGDMRGPHTCDGVLPRF